MLPEAKPDDLQTAIWKNVFAEDGSSKLDAAALPAVMAFTRYVRRECTCLSLTDKEDDIAPVLVFHRSCFIITHFFTTIIRTLCGYLSLWTRSFDFEGCEATLNSKEMKERSKANEGNGEGLYARGRTHRMDSHQSRVKSRSKSQSGRHKCYICQSEDHLKRNCLKNNRNKSTCYVKKDDQPSSSGSIYDGYESEEKNMDKHDDISEDPFHIYSLLKKKDKVVSNKDSEFSMKYPPGFTPNEGSDGASMHVEEGRGGNSENGNKGNVDVDNAIPSGNHFGMNSKEGGTESVCSRHFKKSKVPRTGGSILSLLDDVVKVGQVMRYKMDGCMSNMAEIIESQGDDEVTRMAFYVFGTPMHLVRVVLLCQIISLWFVAYGGKMKGEVVVMGDFNEVRNRSDRFGSVFNVQGVNVFNSFISSAGLVEVSLSGCSFTWCHKSATKMSKLDRFLVSESLLNTCPNISAITLERYLSDHRPILLPQCKADLEAVEVIIDSGNGNEEIAIKRMELVKNLHILISLIRLKLHKRLKLNGLLKEIRILVFSMMRFLKRLSLEQQVELESEVSNEEIKRAVWDCGTDKAPGPDGFTFGFYRYFWYLIDNDVYNDVKYFFMHGEIPKGCNSSFIALIPKIPDANLILDGLFILDELIQWCKRKKKQFLVFKVDFEKAYDSVRWDFLDDILRKFGFGEKWCKWIQSCLRSSRGSIILNGSPTKEFQFYKGLKQGDPLSPFLFILIMESLHLSFQRVEDAGMFKGLGRGG
nr:RNA-directed DNA polymerase, eukaryota, reverse transcriptase zinc-binding domain protein [Tanacetum cinerariifolium]